MANALTRERLSMGVDIGSQVVKIVLAERAGSRVGIAGALSVPSSIGALESGVVRDPKRFGRALAAKLADHPLVDAAAIVSIPSNMAVLRWVTLPLLEGEELREAARFKVKRHLPFPVETAYVEASTPEAEGNDTAGQSLVIAVRREVIDSRAEALEYADIKTIGAELEAQAILRIVERKLSEQSALWRDASLTIIDMGANNTHMYVVQNQRLQFIRGVKFGSSRFAQAVATELECSLERAEEVIAGSTTQLSPDGMLHLTVSDIPAKINVQAETEKLTREFLRLLRYFRSLHPERSYAGILDHVLLCGGFAGVQGVAEFLQTVLGLRVERAKPFAGMVGKFNRETFESISSRQEAFTVAVGLALSGLALHGYSTGEHSVRREFTWARSA